MSTTPVPKCGATGRSGKPCGKSAGWGTDHNGYGNCKLHGGATPNGIKHAQTEQAERAVAVYGLAREVDPHSALLEELHRTAGHVAWLGQKIAEFDTDSDLKQYASTVSAGDDEKQDRIVWEKPAVWVELYHRERKHFAAIAKTCVDVGIEERRVQIAEQTGHLIARVLRGVLEDLGVADHPEAPRVVRRHLTLVSADAA